MKLEWDVVNKSLFSFFCFDSLIFSHHKKLRPRNDFCLTNSHCWDWKSEEFSIRRFSAYFRTKTADAWFIETFLCHPSGQTLLIRKVSSPFCPFASSFPSYLSCRYVQSPFSSILSLFCDVRYQRGLFELDINDVSPNYGGCLLYFREYVSNKARMTIFWKFSCILICHNRISQQCSKLQIWM